MNHIIPVQTAPTDMIYDDQGKLVKSVEHYRQGDHYYDIEHYYDENGNEIPPVDEQDATEADKDAALTTLGVDMTEGVAQ